MTVIPIVNGALSAVTKVLMQRLEDVGIRGIIETTQTTALVRSARLLRKLEETYWDLGSNEKPSADAGQKNLGVK